jgi:hypothetical protein
MSALFKKMNLGTIAHIHVLGAPESFDVELAQLAGVTVRKTLARAEQSAFVLAFAITQAELDRLSAIVVRAATGDAVVWIAYPKGSSRRYSCEFNRDSGWSVLGAAGFEPVRQVAIDADWSALRFRRVAFIKTMTRRPSMALSAEGRRKAGKR